MRGDLKYRIGRSVDDRISGALMICAQLRDDLCAGGGSVSQYVVATGEGAKPPDELLRKAFGIRGERQIQHDSRQFPVTGGGVLTSRNLGHPSKRSARSGHGRHGMKWRNVAQASTRQIGQSWCGHLTHMLKGSRVIVTVQVCIRLCADTYAIKYNGDEQQSFETVRGLLDDRAGASLERLPKSGIRIGSKSLRVVMAVLEHGNADRYPACQRA